MDPERDEADDAFDPQEVDEAAASDVPESEPVDEFDTPDDGESSSPAAETSFDGSIADALAAERAALGSDFNALQDPIEILTGRSANANHTAGDLLLRPGDQGTIELVPYRPDRDGGPSAEKVVGNRNDASRGADASASASDLSPHAQGLLVPTSDGGPPLARPIILVRRSDEVTHTIIREALAAAAKRDGATCREIAEERVNYAFWVRECEERAVFGDY